MAATNVFTPAGSTTLAVTGTAASVTLPVCNGNQIMIQNTGIAVGWWVVGAVTATASAATGASTPVAPGAVMLFTIDPNATVLSGVTAATGTTTTFYVTRGAGV